MNGAEVLVGCVAVGGAWLLSRRGHHTAAVLWAIGVIGLYAAPLAVTAASLKLFP